MENTPSTLNFQGVPDLQSRRWLGKYKRQIFSESVSRVSFIGICVRWSEASLVSCADLETARRLVLHISSFKQSSGFSHDRTGIVENIIIYFLCKKYSTSSHSA